MLAKVEDQSMSQLRFVFDIRSIAPVGSPTPIADVLVKVRVSG